MNRRKPITFIVIFGILSFIWALSSLVNVWEEGAKRGYAQVVFMIGVVLGMTAILIITRIESWISERCKDRE